MVRRGHVECSHEQGPQKQRSRLHHVLPNYRFSAQLKANWAYLGSGDLASSNLRILPVLTVVSWLVERGSARALFLKPLEAGIFIQRARKPERSCRPVLTFFQN